MLRILQRPLAILAALLALLSAPCLRAQAPIVDEPNFTPTLVFDVATIRLAPPIVVEPEDLDWAVDQLEAVLTELR